MIAPVTPADLTDAMIHEEACLAIERGDKTFARLCDRALSRTVPSALQRICNVSNARMKAGAK